MELAIDTSTESASIALSSRGKVQVELTWHCGRNHTAELVPNLIHLLRLSRAELKDIEGIIVAKGPGSFTGVRVGIATAKGLSLGLGIPLVGISTLEVAAFPYAAFPFPTCPILSAGRGEIAVALFQTKNGSWKKLVEEHITTPAALCSELEGQTIFCGEIDSNMAMQLGERLGASAIIPEGASLLRRAGYLAELGWRRLEAGDYDDLAALQPLYLRKPAVTMRIKEV
jgi:tRNA threonylcarbamoyladenosine biosynthesis protein TsaB